MAQDLRDVDLYDLIANNECLDISGGVEATPQFHDRDGARALMETWQAENDRVLTPNRMRGLAPVRREIEDEEYFDWLGDHKFGANIRGVREDWRRNGMRSDWRNPRGHGEPFAMGAFGTLRAPQKLPPFLEENEEAILERRKTAKREGEKRYKATRQEERRLAAARQERGLPGRQGDREEIFGLPGRAPEPDFGDREPAYQLRDWYDSTAGRIEDWPITPDEFVLGRRVGGLNLW
ncbi:hypothetical protein LTR85_002768 [Meristemomyces frigidus]|nr:hypothetical protein LTR85_002768 [Meristemomyces frigidus]